MIIKSLNNVLGHTEKTRFVAKKFDKLANRYENNRISGWYKANGQILLNNLCQTRRATVLDIGCATGWFLRQAAKKNLIQEGIGIDISPQMVKIAKGLTYKEKCLNLTFINEDWEKFEFDTLKKQKFDVVVCAHTFHYFNDPIRSLDKILSLLNNRGIFFLMDRDITDSVSTRIWEKIHRHILGDIVSFYSADEIKCMMVKVGFANVNKLRRVKRLLWKKKVFTSLVVFIGLKDNSVIVESHLDAAGVHHKQGL